MNNKRPYITLPVPEKKIIDGSDSDQTDAKTNKVLIDLMKTHLEPFQGLGECADYVLFLSITELTFHLSH